MVDGFGHKRVFHLKLERSVVGSVSNWVVSDDSKQDEYLLIRND